MSVCLFVVVVVVVVVVTRFHISSNGLAYPEKVAIPLLNSWLYVRETKYRQSMKSLRLRKKLKHIQLFPQTRVVCISSLFCLMQVNPAKC